MDVFLSYLQSVGPFSTPLSVAMAFALRWVLKDRTRLLADLKIAQDDRFKLREKRADDLGMAATEYREFGEAQRSTIQGLIDTTKQALERMTRNGG